MRFDFFLPLLTYPDPTPLDAVMRAVDFAATLGGTLSLEAHIVDVQPVSNPLAVPLVDVSALWHAAVAKSRERAETLTRESRHFAERLMLPANDATFSCRTDALDSHLAEAARTHDMTLVGLDSTSPSHIAAAEALIFGSGGPVVLFSAATATHLQTVTVAWDGSRAAARAVRDALPILSKAAEVVLLTVSDDKHVPATGVSKLGAFLRQHGVNSRHHDVSRQGSTIGETLQSHALAHDAGLLVMGAYGHSRFREFVLGGATRNVLANLRLPVFMSH